MSALGIGCDTGSRDDAPAHGPALHVVATYPADGQGTNTSTDAGVDCDTPTPDCAVPTDVAIELRFDRFLLPGGGLAAGLHLFSGDPQANAVALTAHYDVIERVVILQTSHPLRPNTLYTATIEPGSDPNQGFWAFDRAPLEVGPVPLSFSFTTGSGPAAPTTPAPTRTDNCSTIAKPAERAGDTLLPAGPLNICTGTCHQDPPRDPPTTPADRPNTYPPMGLSLSDWGLQHTAINRVAHETETGNSALDPGFEAAARFGVQMNIVDPGSPENSFLIYKLLRKQNNYALDEREVCPATFHAPVSDGACLPPSDAELARLREWFVLGDPMPKDTESPKALSRDELVRVANWISAGAVCTVP